jgi:hypothetical protein
MRFRRRFLIAAIVFSVAPSYAPRAQDLSAATTPSARDASSPAKTGGAKLEAKQNGRNASPPADPKEFDWSGSYGGVHGGVLSSTDRSYP